MATSVRIDGLPILHPDGRIEVKFTAGRAPLPLTAAGNSQIFSDRADLAQRLRAFEESLTEEQQLLFVLSLWWKRDPNFADPRHGQGRSITVDLSGAASVLVAT